LRLLFLLLQCLDSALAYGGKVEVTQQDTSWTIRAEGPRLRVDPGLWGLLSTPPATVDIDAGQVHFALVADELARQERRLTIKISETVIQISL
jgi:histidine phosphotransferase ChpT